ncbi:MAG: DUF2846 domain-containing protein [Chitinophagaceae bacterium]
MLMVILVSGALYGQEIKDSSSSTQNAKVYFLRSTGFQGSAQGFTTFIDDKVVCKLNNKRFSIHEVIPGTHYFSVQFAGKNSKEKAERIEIELEAGKIYYIQLIFQTGLLKNNLYCQEVTKSSAITMMDKLKEDNCQL